MTGTTDTILASDCNIAPGQVLYTNAATTNVTLPTTGLTNGCHVDYKALGGSNSNVIFTAPGGVAGSIDGGTTLTVYYPGDGDLTWNSVTGWTDQGGHGVRGASTLVTAGNFPKVTSDGTVGPSTSTDLVTELNTSPPATPLSHNLLPALISADIPANAANTSGTAGGLSGTPTLPLGTKCVTGTTGEADTNCATNQQVANMVVPCLQATGASGAGASSVSYMLPCGAVSMNTAENVRMLSYPRSGIISNLWVCTNGTQGNGALTFTYRIGTAAYSGSSTGQANTALTVTFPTSASAECLGDSTHSFAYTAGYPLDIAITNAATAASAAFTVVYAEFKAAN